MDPDEILEDALDELEAEQDASAADIQTLITAQLEEAQEWFDEEVEPPMVEATDYYHGRQFGNEVEGRSRVVIPVLRTVVRRQLPSIMRNLFGTQRPLEFVARRADQIEIAAQQTRAVEYVIRDGNDGFRAIQDAVLDAQVRRIGWLKWWWEDMSRVTSQEYRGLTEAQVGLLARDPSVEIEEDSLVEDGPPQEINGQMVQLWALVANRRDPDGRPRMAAVPNEEVLISPDARTPMDAALVAHSRLVPIDLAVSMGVPEEMARAHIEERLRLDDSLEDARSTTRNRSMRRQFGTRDPSQEQVLLTEAYVLVDGDGDGIAERRKFVCVGDNYEIANGDEEGLGPVVDEVPLAALLGAPEPHELIGLSEHDNVSDLQVLQSEVWRGTLNSLTEAISPSQVTNPSITNLGDVVSPEIGRTIRTDGDPQSAIAFLQHTFVGRDTLPILASLDEEVEERTGTTRASQGLNADALQSTTALAVAGTFTAAQQTVELITRNLAESGLKQLYKGVLRLLISHPIPGQVMRLGGRYVEVDPREWNADLDLRVRIGTKSVQEQLTFFQTVLADQKEQMQLGSPLVSFLEVRNTLHRLIELGGDEDAAQFYKPWSAEDQAQWDEQQRIAAENAPPPPEQILAQAEMLKARINAQKVQIDALNAAADAKANDDRERDLAAQKVALEAMKLEVESAVKLEIERFKATAQAVRDEESDDDDVA